MVILNNITKEFNEFVLKDINLEIKKGEIFTLLGGSGCGKSTLLKIISGIIKKYDGNISIDGVDGRSKNPVELGLSMVFQDSLLLPNLNVEDNIAFGLKMKGIDRNTRLKKARETLIDLDLKGFEKRHPSDLSGGQKQRVAIARALVMEPKVLLMDEPFSALDEELRGRLQKLLKKIQKKYESTILFVTHDRDEAFYLSDRIGVMNTGIIAQVGTPKEVYESPKNTYIARFLGINNIITGNLEGEFLVRDKLSIYIGKNKDFTSLALKAEDLRVISRDNIRDKRHLLEGVIEDYTFKSGFYHIDVIVGNTHIEVVQNRVEVDLYRGSKIAIEYNYLNNIYIKEELC